MPTSSSNYCLPVLTSTDSHGDKITRINCPDGLATLMASKESTLLLAANDHVLVITAHGRGPGAYLELTERRGGEKVMLLNQTQMQCDPNWIDEKLPNALHSWLKRGTSITTEEGKEMASAALQAYAAQHPVIIEKLRKAEALLPPGRVEHNAEVLQDLLDAPESLRLACPVPMVARNSPTR